MFQESTKPLLRPAQAEERHEEVERLKAILSAPPHIANRIEDRGQMTRNLRAIERDLVNQDPQPYGAEEIDLAITRSDQLKDEILQGMPTREEMRRNPSGSVDKHRRWEKRNKPKLSEWKNIQLRLHKNDHGDLPDATDVANFERYRPSGGSQELNMHNEQIPGRVQFGPEPGAGPSVVLDESEMGFLESVAPDIAGQLVTMTNDQRQAVKSFIFHQIALQQIETDENVPMDLSYKARGHEPLVDADGVPLGEHGQQTKRKGRDWTPERRKEFGRKMKAARAAKRQEG